jgi:N-acyl-D-aspartate/D-glutamate deacylase
VTADLVVRGGLVVDGTGAEAKPADIAITDGAVSAVGSGLSGARVLDATDHVVAPGFIDIHTHYDAQVFWDPTLSPSCYHGTTTVIAGNCGFTVAPVRAEDPPVIISTLERVEDMNARTLRAGVPWGSFESFGSYLDAVERRGVQLNFGCYLGHSALRRYVMGDACQERTADAGEIREMRRLVTEALHAGAAGFSSSFGRTHVGVGGRPVPSRYSDLTELCALVEPLGDLGTGLVALQVGPPIEVEDLPSVQRHARRPLTWTPMIVRDGYPHRAILARSAEARREGADVWPQTSSRPIAFQETLGDPFTFNLYPAFAELAGRGPEARMAAYADPAWRARAGDQTGPGAERPIDWRRITVDESERYPVLVGRSIDEIARMEDNRPLDVVLDLALGEGLRTRFGVVVGNDDPEAVGELVADDAVLLGLGDGGAHVGQIYDACFPTDLLATWVRERRALSLERAVWKLSGLPARILGLGRRGRLVPGAAADVVVFQPDTVAPGPVRRLRDLPADGERLLPDAPSGMRHVLVNGVPIRVEGQQLGPADASPGRLLRREWGEA